MISYTERQDRKSFILYRTPTFIYNASCQTRLATILEKKLVRNLSFKNSFINRLVLKNELALY